MLTRSTLSALCQVNQAVPLLDHRVVVGTAVRLCTEDTEPTVLYRHRRHLRRS